MGILIASKNKMMFKLSIKEINHIGKYSKVWVIHCYQRLKKATLLHNVDGKVSWY